MPLSDLVAAHRRVIDGLEEQAFDRLRTPYQQAMMEVLARLLELEAQGAGDSFTASHLTAILAQLQDALSMFVGAAADPFLAEFTAAAEIGASQMLAEMAGLEAAFGTAEAAGRIGAIAPVIPAHTVAQLADPTRLLLYEFGDRVYAGVARELAVAVVQGEGARDAARRLRGEIEGQDWQLLRIARTEMNNAANVGHEAAIAQVDAEYPDLEMKGQWLARLDGRESDICRALNGQVRAPGEYFEALGWRGTRPPGHVNCRSRLIPFRQAWLDWEAANGIKGARLEAYAEAGGCGPSCEHKEEPMLRKRNGQEAEFKALAFEIKAFDAEAGTFEGYAAAYNSVDSYGDVIRKGAFAETIAQAAAAGKKFPILWQHDPDHPIGVAEASDMAEDDYGLKVKGKLVLGVQKADEARALMAAGALGGLSIGYSVPKGGATKATKNAPAGTKRELVKISLWEFSPVTFPANAGAIIGGVKAADLATIMEFEEKRSELCRRRWRIDDALWTANESAAGDDTLTTDAKIAAISVNFAQYQAAMVGWFREWLTLLDAAKEAGLLGKGGPGPDEVKGIVADMVKAGRVLSAANVAKLSGAKEAMAAAVGALDELLTAATPAPAGDTEGEQKDAGEPDAAGAGNPPQEDNPPAPDAPGGEVSEGEGTKAAGAAVASALDRMRRADALARMQAAK